MPFSIKIKGEFCAAMQLPTDGPCSRLHGHTYQVTAEVSAQQPQADGMICDYNLLHDKLQELLKQLDYQYLNEHPAFINTVPSCEQLAYWIFQEFKRILQSIEVEVKSISVQEREHSQISYSEE